MRLYGRAHQIIDFRVSLAAIKIIEYDSEHTKKRDLMNLYIGSIKHKGPRLGHFVEARIT